ncbi:MAG TPA: sodium:proton antiporter [Bacillota bacterium]|nr:sodium:proton antiporter [Bacillota bacterium]
MALLEHRLALYIMASIPFLLILLSIAIVPLIFPSFWEKNTNKLRIVTLLALPVAILLMLVNRHELFSAIEEYISFILLLSALFIISGGVYVSADLRATPKVNTLFLLIGAVCANLIGTTGASMLLIRPLLRTNSERKHTKHIITFFIFVVSNIGGALTPLGDPPLFLGYLRGVPFTWTLSLFPIWLTCIAVLLSLFYLWDLRCYKNESLVEINLDSQRTQPFQMKGLLNVVYLLIIVVVVFFQIPSPFREITMLATIILSLVGPGKEIRRTNGFSFHPIMEVAILFIGIFVTMKPLMLVLEAKGAEFGIVRPWQYFWLVGGLSSFLDNAPTYVTFFSMAESVTRTIGAGGHAMIAGVRSDLLAALSCGAVFMGANTYIGNGPNFMIKSIAEAQGYKVPQFFEYMLYAAGVLIPIFAAITLIFFMGS